jgi:hypothetical protein
MYIFFAFCSRSSFILRGSGRRSRYVEIGAADQVSVKV